MHNLDFSKGARRRAIAKEPIRDWSIGFITGHRTRIILCMTSVCLFYLALYFAFPRGKPPTRLLNEIWAWSSLLWLSALLPGTLGLIGALTYRHPVDLDETRPIRRTICWRIVTSGKNISVVLSTIRRCQIEMANAPLAPYVIEVVIDYGDNVRLLPINDDDVRVITVPTEYRTPNNSRFKARALHYALWHSPIPDTTWVVHLDEETQPTLSAVKGICKFIREEELSEKLRVGQGVLLYHRELEKHPLLTMADNVRTGDDFARFYFQTRLGVTVFGLHGSFIVVRNDVEKATGGFDFGRRGDLTEDAFWAVKATGNGVRCAWVDGYLEEQSCMSLQDFLRQRRRWFQGLMKVVLYAPVKIRWRFCLGLNMILWGLTPFSMLYTLAHLFCGGWIDPMIRVLASYSFAALATLYFTGLKANLDEHGVTGMGTRASLTLLQFLLLPVLLTLEGLAVLWAMITPVKGFDVVKK